MLFSQFGVNYLKFNKKAPPRPIPLHWKDKDMEISFYSINMTNVL